MNDPMNDRMLELKSRLDELAAEFTDVLAQEDQTAPLLTGVVLVTGYGDPTDPDNETWVRAIGSATTSDLARIGLLSFAAARAIE